MKKLTETQIKSLQLLSRRDMESGTSEMRSTSSAALIKNGYAEISSSSDASYESYNTPFTNGFRSRLVPPRCIMPWRYLTQL